MYTIKNSDDLNREFSQIEQDIKRLKQSFCDHTDEKKGYKSKTSNIAIYCI